MRGGACSQANENQMLPSLPGMPHSLLPQKKSSMQQLDIDRLMCSQYSTLYQDGLAATELPPTGTYEVL